VYNLPAFGDAFGCKAGTAMQAKAEQRVVLWPSAMPAPPPEPAKSTKKKK
jgi:putative endopeptidase